MPRRDDDLRRRARIPGTVWLVVGVALSVWPTIATAQQQSDTGGEDAVATVEAHEIAFAKTMADRDLEAFLSFVSPEAVFFAGNQPLRGREAIRAAWAPFFEGPTAPFSWQPDLVEVLASGDLALSSGPVYSAAGDQVGRFNTVWRRDGEGRWQVVFDKGS